MGNRFDGSMNEDVQGAKTAFITGAAGGLGTALVQSCLRGGWRVTAASRRPHVWPAHERLRSIVLDVTDASAINRALASSTVDCLVHNAGFTADALSWLVSEEAWEQVLAVNLTAAFRCARAVARSMMKQREGHIILISSFAGRAGSRGQAPYAAAKAGLFGLCQSLARELGSRNIRVNAVLPGVLRTGMTEGLSEEQMQAFTAANVLGRINTLEEVASFVAFLASTRNISGQLFQLDSRISPWT